MSNIPTPDTKSTDSKRIAEFNKMFKNTSWYPNNWQPIEQWILTTLAEVRKEICVCAALKTKDGRVFRGQRHGDCMYAANRAYWTVDDIQNAEQGFVTSTGRFVGREEGRKLQDAAGIKSASRDGYQADTLFSEDLY